ncbi:BrnT family toxin [Leptospira wolffii]|uniref:BrnT family toxin n=1 Tax=Leptospira wolffii TaxID=409998 RepID=UPI00108275CF|nr:BrnT family toxin [Leptospira wolffii]TGK58177.1 BrnT family toxin [Leptospira wolffii]TGK67395.1 BrnT family toxin [Leptospira wolffii]TGK68855.1 BrnT family toxin [Leptospira wolffii]TGL27207.1 BrnT family toxin [Leptospira wolffii]
MLFEWDDKKNSSNLKKHQISFEQVFLDKDAIYIPDENHSEDEERWLVLGKIANFTIIVVVFVDKSNKNEEKLRIISARKADKLEEKEYFQRIGKD